MTILQLLFNACCEIEVHNFSSSIFLLFQARHALDSWLAIMEVYISHRI